VQRKSQRKATQVNSEFSLSVQWVQRKQRKKRKFRPMATLDTRRAGGGVLHFESNLG
jgi:hypothetical protein